MRIFLILLYLILSINANVLAAQDYFQLLASTNPIILTADLPEKTHLYWKNPGDLGKPLEINLIDSENISDYEVLWPEPKELQEGDKISFILENKITIPISLKFIDQNKPAIVDIKIEGSICSNKSCMPYIQAIKAQIQPSINSNTSTLRTLYLILISLAGGIILNFMPCILPVLSLKLLSLVKTKSKTSILCHVLGIFAVFNALSLSSILMQSSGESFGFGMQFQNPQLVIALCCGLVFLISLSLDKVSFNMPNTLVDKLSGVSNVSKYFLDFINGIIAALLSTSCSAPFLGVALGLAMVSSPAINIMIFNLIALGFSMPYILLLVFPRIIELIPKTGSWLKVLKKITTIMLIATLVWLIFILYGQLGLRATLGLFGLLILIKAAIENQISSIVKTILFCILFLAAMRLPMYAATEDEKYEQFKESIWQDFSNELLEQNIAAGKTVFVDITADWCATCKYNKAFVLDRSWTVNSLKKHKVVNLRGSLNQPNPEVDIFMHKYNAYAIPFNVVYGPENKKGLILPVDYSYEDLMHAINIVNTPHEQQP